MQNNLEITNKLLEAYSEYYETEIVSGFEKLDTKVSEELKKLLADKVSVFKLKVFFTENKLSVKQIRTFKLHNNTCYVIELSIGDKKTEINVMSLLSFLHNL